MHHEAEEFVADMKREIHKRDEKIKGQWVIVSTYRTGGMVSRKMSYADAVKEVDKMKLGNVRIASKNKNLGLFQPTYEIKKADKI